MPKISCPRRCSFLCFFLLLTVVTTSCASLRAQHQQMPVADREPPNLGVRIINVTPEGQLERAGIQVMDLLSNYGKFKVIDHSTYYKAREFYLKTPDKKVQVQFWRGRTPLTLELLPGTLGGSTNEYNVVAYSSDIEMVQLAAALSGNMDKFIEASRKRKETMPKEYETLKLETDSIEAFALSITGNDTLAREVVARSTVKDRVEARLKHHWRIYPHGNKVVENWMRLAANK